MFFDIFREAISSIGFYVGGFLSVFWPLLLFGILVPMARSLWLGWRQLIFVDSVEWALLELRIPREIKKSPQAMEQVLMAMHNLGLFPPTPAAKWREGQFPVPFSFEIVSFGGQLHFFVRTPVQSLRIVEAAFFSYYPDVEVVEVPDYVTDLPYSSKEAALRGLKVAGGEIGLKREDAYPIKSYKDFEAPEEERQFDPITAIIEILGKAKPGETVAVQILASPADEKWAKAWESFVDDMKEPKVKTSGKDDNAKTLLVMRSPGETDTLKAVEHNLSKPAFESLIRYLYVAREDAYYESQMRKGIQGAFNQYAAMDLNSFVMNWGMVTLTSSWFFPYVFSKRRNNYKKNRIIVNYMRRLLPPKTGMGKFVTSYLFNFNTKSKTFKITTESLATIFHPPTFLVLTAPHIHRVESKKSGPPAGLPIYGNDEDIAEFQS
jgi:hypothetical protein